MTSYLCRYKLYRLLFRLKKIKKLLNSEDPNMYQTIAFRSTTESGIEVVRENLYRYPFNSNGFILNCYERSVNIRYRMKSLYGDRSILNYWRNLIKDPQSHPRLLSSIKKHLVYDDKMRFKIENYVVENMDDKIILNFVHNMHSDFPYLLPNQDFLPYTFKKN